MFEQWIKLLKALNSDAKPWQISSGFCLGLIAGLLPLYTPSLMVVVALACMIRVNIAMCLLAFTVFSAIAWMFDQSILLVGQSALQAPEYQSLWTQWHQHDGLLFLQFNHTQVMGAWLIAAGLAPFMFIVVQILVIKYRAIFLAWFKQTKLMKWLGMNKWYQRATTATAIASELK